jgi:hypothetical protein
VGVFPGFHDSLGYLLHIVLFGEKKGEIEIGRQLGAGLAPLIGDALNPVQRRTQVPGVPFAFFDLRRKLFHLSRLDIYLTLPTRCIW